MRTKSRIIFGVLVAAVLLGLLMTFSGPRLRSVESNTEELLLKNNSIHMRFNQRLRSEDTAVRISPDVNMQVRTYQDTVVIEILEPLRARTEYTIHMRVVSQASGRETIRDIAITTPDHAYAYVRRSGDLEDGPDKIIIRSRGNDRELSSAVHIDMLAVDGGIYTATTMEYLDGDVSVILGSLSSRKTSVIDTAKRIRGLQIVEGVGIVGYIATKDGDTPERLYFYDIESKLTFPIQIGDTEEGIVDWEISPDGSTACILNESGEIYVFATDDERASEYFGQYTRIVGFGHDGQSLYLERSGVTDRIDLESGQSVAVAPQPELSLLNGQTRHWPLNAQQGTITETIYYDDAQQSYASVLYMDREAQDMLIQKINSSSDSITSLRTTRNDEYAVVESYSVAGAVFDGYPSESRPSNVRSLIYDTDGALIDSIDGIHVQSVRAR